MSKMVVGNVVIYDGLNIGYHSTDGKNCVTQFPFPVEFQPTEFQVVTNGNFTGGGNTLHIEILEWNTTANQFVSIATSSTVTPTGNYAALRGVLTFTFTDAPIIDTGEWVYVSALGDTPKYRIAFGSTVGSFPVMNSSFTGACLAIGTAMKFIGNISDSEGWVTIPVPPAVIPPPNFENNSWFHRNWLWILIILLIIAIILVIFALAYRSRKKKRKARYNRRYR